jgi:hypothetical protein
MRLALRCLLAAPVLVSCFPCFAQSPSSPAPENTYLWLRNQFADPSADYSTMPFLVWNGEVSEAEIDRHLQAFKDQGIRGFFIHPRYGLITEYLSPRWNDLIIYTVKRARAMGMKAWLYDENSFPSGFAGGHVNEQMPESWTEGQGLREIKQTKLAPEAGKRYAAILRRSGEAWTDITSNASAWAGKDGEFVLFEITFYPKSPWYGGWTYVDLIHPGVTQKFNSITLGSYLHGIGGNFGFTVPGIFSDEPNIEPPDKDSVRWTPDLFEQFHQRFGYDLAPALPSLFEESGNWRKVRHDYFSLLLDLFIERWSKPYYETTEKLHLKWTGHYWEHEWPNPWQGPDNMAMYAWHQQPGIDLLFNQFAEGVNAQFGNVRSAREVASVAYQMGRKRVFCETYGAGGWELRFEDMKRLGDWEYAEGINFMNQHLSFSTLAGGRKYDFPQSFGEHDSWWPQYHVLASYFARLSLALSAGETRNDTLIIEPTTSAWMYAARPQSSPHLMEIGNAFQQFLNALEARQIEYDLGSEQILRENAASDGGKLKVHERSYSRVVLPPGTESLDAATIELLRKFIAGGGTVLSFVDPPKLVSGDASDEVAKLAAKFPAKWIRLNAPEELIAHHAGSLSHVQVSGGKLFHLRRRLADGEILFLVNSSLEDAARGSFRAEGTSVSQFDAFSGKTSPYFNASLENAARKPAKPGVGIEIAFDIPPAGSLLLYVADRGGVAPIVRPRGPALASVKPLGPLAMKRLSPNVLKLDYLDLHYAGEPTTSTAKGIYFYKAQDAIFKHFGLGGNPWLSTVQFKTDILDKDHFPDASGFDAAYHFNVADGVSLDGMQVVVERPWLWKVELNGTELKTPKDDAWWIDPDFGRYEAGSAVHRGENVLRISAQPFSVHHELEPAYILGDFGVHAEAAGFRIVPAKALTAGSWKDEDMPFFSDRIAYTRHFTLKAGAATKVRLGDWHGVTAEVRVNGKTAATMVNPPWETDIASLVHDGDNEVEVIVYGSLKNLFGPHHGKITRGIVTPWNHRYAPEKQPAGSAYDLESVGLMEEFTVVAGK